MSARSSAELARTQSVAISTRSRPWTRPARQSSRTERASGTPRTRNYSSAISASGS
jgi:hypothetical protein